jgi:hypothetical protein
MRLGDKATAGLVGVVAILAYWPALRVGFTVRRFFHSRPCERSSADSAIRSRTFPTSGFFEYYRPLTFLSHAVDWHFWGMNPLGYHITNIALHAGSSVLVCLLGYRLGGRTTGIVAGALFALHPAGQEAVYWISARFDLLATGLALASLLLYSRDGRGYLFGVLAFGLALLAKESAIALPVILLAHDVIIRSLEWRRAARRLAPIVIVAIGYALLRSHAGALEAAGGASRLPKILALAALIAGLLWLARAPQLPARLQRFVSGRTLMWVAVGGAGAVFLALVLSPASLWLRSKIGFASFSAFYLLSPVTFPPLPASLFDLPEVPVAAVELALLVMVLIAFVRAAQWIAARPPALFCVVFAIAALVPVSSMTASPRYLYLASAGVLMLAGLIVESRPMGVGLRRAVPVLAGVLALSFVQIVAAGRSWKWASDMTRDSLALMSAALQPCGTQDVIILTTPAGIRGVYSNLNEVAFSGRRMRPGVICDGASRGPRRCRHRSGSPGRRYRTARPGRSGQFRRVTRLARVRSTNHRRRSRGDRHAGGPARERSVCRGPDLQIDRGRPLSPRALLLFHRRRPEGSPTLVLPDSSAASSRR